MRFIDIARPLIEQGIAVIPVKSNSKDPALVLHGAHDASLDLAQIEAWDRHQPGNNCGAVARPDGYWFLDLDDVPGFLTMSGRTTLPDTRAVKTRRGLHLYFKQNDLSRSMSNFKMPNIGEVRCLNEYVVAAGSTHPSGQPYEVANSFPIVEAPDGLVDYLMTLKATARVVHSIPGIPDEAAVSDRLSWLCGWTKDHGVEVLETPTRTKGGEGRGRKICVTCPRKHLHTSDGNPSESVILIGPDGTLAYKCQHNHCDDLNWAKFRAAYEPPLTPERLAKLTGVVALPGDPVVIQEKVRPNFDRACLYGRLGEIALMLHVPLGMAYLDLITCYSVLVPRTPRIRTNLYTINIGPPQSYKGEAALRAERAVKVMSEKTTIASDRGLGGILTGLNGDSILVYQGELLVTMKKMQIQGSALAPALCEFWSADEGGTADKKGNNKVKARVSLLGNLPIRKQSDFKNIFSSETTLGFCDRTLLACADLGEETEWVNQEDLGLEAIPDFIPSLVNCSAARERQMNAWVQDRKKEFPTLPRQGRLGEMLLRIAVILCSANGESEISDGAFEAASILCYKQCQLRVYYAPSEALDIGARIFEFFRDYIRSQDGYAVGREKLLLEARESLQCGPCVVLREFRAAVEGGMLRWDRDPDVDACFLPGAQ